MGPSVGVSLETRERLRSCFRAPTLTRPPLQWSENPLLVKNPIRSNQFVTFKATSLLFTLCTVSNLPKKSGHVSPQLSFWQCQEFESSCYKNPSLTDSVTLPASLLERLILVTPCTNDHSSYLMPRSSVRA